jgi:hypothetical protein
MAEIYINRHDQTMKLLNFPLFGAVFGVSVTSGPVVLNLSPDCRKATFVAILGREFRHMFVALDDGIEENVRVERAIVGLKLWRATIDLMAAALAIVKNFSLEANRGNEYIWKMAGGRIRD